MLEFSLNSDRTQAFLFALNYTYLDSEYTRYDEYNLVIDNNGPDYGGSEVIGTYDLSGNTVPRTSKHTVYLEGNYQATPNWLLTTGLNYRSSQYVDEMNTVKYGGYTVVDLRTTYNTNVSGFDVELYANADNIFDKQYFMMPRMTGDRNQDSFYDIRDMGLTVNPGRTFLMGLKVNF